MTSEFGCPDDQRNRLTLAQPYASLVTACVSEDRTTIHLENASSVVLRVWPVSGGTSTWTWEEPDEEQQEKTLAGDLARPQG